MRGLAEKETPLKIFQTHAAFSDYASGMTRRPEDIPLLFPDPVIEAYLKDVDRTLIRSMLQKSATERVAALVEMNRLTVEGQRIRERERAAAL